MAAASRARQSAVQAAAVQVGLIFGLGVLTRCNIRSIMALKTTTTTTMKTTRTNLSPSSMSAGRLVAAIVLISCCVTAAAAAVLSGSSRGSGGDRPSSSSASSTLPTAAAAAAVVKSNFGHSQPSKGGDDITYEPDAADPNYAIGTRADLTTSASLHERRRGAHRVDPVAWPSGDNGGRLGVKVNESLSDLFGEDDDDEDDEGLGGGGAEVAGAGAVSANVDSPKANGRRLLVRQLTHLIMNHEPETIAESMEGTPVSGQMVSESGSSDTGQQQQQSSQQAFGHSLMMLSNSNNDNNNYNNDELSRLAPIQDDQLVSASNQEQDSDNQRQQERAAANEMNANSNNDNDGGQSGTCPPDYDDQATIEAAASNLTAEQQQQLLAGADSSGLLVHQGGANGSGQGGGGGGSQCVMPGVQMIELITKTITPIVFSVIIVVGLVGNIIVMMVILEDRKTERELTPTNLLVLDLSLADLSFIIFCIPFTGWDYAVGHWVFGSLWCKCNQYLIVVCALSSIYTLVLMSFDRFFAIVYPIESISYRTSKNTLHAIYIKWIIILLLASPTLPRHGLTDSPLEPNQYNCRFLADQYNPLHFQVVFFMTSYLLPLILIFGLYASLLKKLLSGSGPHGHKESLKMRESKKKVAWLVGVIVMMFAICWCPIQVMLILMRLRSHKITVGYIAFQVFAHTLGYFNSCINPFIYVSASETFQDSFRRSSLGRFTRACLCLTRRNSATNTHNHHHHQQPQQQQLHHHHLAHHQQQNHDRSANFGTTTTHDTTTSSLNHHQHQATAMWLQQQQQQPQQHALNHISSLSTSPGGNGPDQGNGSSNISITALSMTPHNDGGGFSSVRNNEQNTVAATRPVVLALEPRDREVPPIGPVGSGGLAQLRRQTPDESGTRTGQDLGGGGGGAKVPAKQQLVARVVQTGGSQVSHRCEPRYQQEEELKTP